MKLHQKFIVLRGMCIKEFVVIIIFSIFSIGIEFSICKVLFNSTSKESFINLWIIVYSMAFPSHLNVYLMYMYILVRLSFCQGMNSNNLNDSNTVI